MFWLFEEQANGINIDWFSCCATIFIITAPAYTHFISRLSTWVNDNSANIPYKIVRRDALNDYYYDFYLVRSLWQYAVYFKCSSHMHT